MAEVDGFAPLGGQVRPATMALQILGKRASGAPRIDPKHVQRLGPERDPRGPQNTKPRRRCGNYLMILVGTSPVSRPKSRRQLVFPALPPAVRPRAAISMPHQCLLLPLRLVLLAWGVAAALPVVAAPEEIQVYEDDLTQIGGFGVDVHNNLVLSGPNTLAYPGAQPADHVYRLTPEFYYGLSDTLELGLYLLTTRPAGGGVQYDGAKLRVKFIAPHDEQSGPFWGANLEVGRTDRRVAEVPWNIELKGIYGYRNGLWTFAVNPNLDTALGPKGGPVSLDVDFKIAYTVAQRTQLGIESYDEYGPLAKLSALDREYKALFLAVDRDFGSFDLNAGVGRGLTAQTDRWILKFIVGTHF